MNVDTNDCKCRNVIERSYCRLKRRRAIASRYDKHALTCGAAVAPHSAIT